MSTYWDEPLTEAEERAAERLVVSAWEPDAEWEADRQAAQAAWDEFVLWCRVLWWGLAAAFAFVLALLAWKVLP